MISLAFHGLKEVVGRYQRASAQVEKSAERAVRLSSILARRKLVERMSARNAPRDPFWGKGSPAGAFLGRRTGQTAARLTPGGLVLRAGNVFRSFVASPDKHVALAEVGGTVQGKSPAGYMRIPTAAAQSASGAEQQRFAGRSLRDVPGVFLVRTHGGRLWAAEAMARAVTLLFLLTRSATHRPRGIFAAVRAEMVAEMAALGQIEARVIVGTATT